MSIRSDIALGAICWINVYRKKYAHKAKEIFSFFINKDRAQALGLLSLDIDRQFTGDEVESVLLFCKKACLSVRDLRRIGEKARLRGCLQDPSERIVHIYPGCHASLLRSPRQGYNQIDGTVPCTAPDSTSRYLVCTNWNNNSAAVDATLFCGLMLDVGRIQLDQINYDLSTLLPGPAAVFRNIIRTPWGLLSQQLRDGLRNGLSKALEEMDPERFARGTAVHVLNVLDVCFCRLPQTSFTQMRCSKCCDGHLKLDNRSEPFRCWKLCLHKTSLALQASLDRICSLQLDWTADSPCSNGSSCNGRRYVGKGFIDRPPLTLLIIIPGGLTKRDDEVVKAFEGFTLAYSQVTRSLTQQYKAVGCVISAGSAHFLCRWMLSDEIFEYNGKRAANCTKVLDNDWFTGLAGDQEVMAIFYRQY